MLNITQWISLNRYFILAEEQRQGMGFGKHEYYGEFKTNIQQHILLKCENCILHNTDDCDKTEDPNKCISYYDKNTIIFKPLTGEHDV